MKLYTWSDCIQGARDFAGDYAGDFDIERLASALFDWCPESDTYVEREYTDAEIEACDVSSWQAAGEMTEDGTLCFERWFQSPLGPVHVGAWEDIDGSVSLTLSTVGDGGVSMWEWSSTTVADTDRPSTWGAFDRAYGSRAAWQADLGTVEEMIRQL